MNLRAQSRHGTQTICSMITDQVNHRDHKLFGINAMVSSIAAYLQLSIKPLEPFEEDMIRLYCHDVPRPVQDAAIMQLHTSTIQSPRFATFTSNLLQNEFISKITDTFSNLQVQVSGYERDRGRSAHWNITFSGNSVPDFSFGPWNYSSEIWSHMITDLHHHIKSALCDRFGYFTNLGEMYLSIGIDLIKPLESSNPFKTHRTKSQLVDIAKSRNLKGFAKLKKSELEHLLFDAERAEHQRQILLIINELKDLVVLFGTREGFRFTRFKVNQVDVVGSLPPSSSTGQLCFL